MNRSLVFAAAAAALFTATAANASRVAWSIGINVPAVTTYVSSGPAYYTEPAYYAPSDYNASPGYYAPSDYNASPAYYAPAPVEYAPRVEYVPRARVWLRPQPAPRQAWFDGRDRWDHDRWGRDRSDHADWGHDRGDHEGDRDHRRDDRGERRQHHDDYGNGRR